MGEAVSLLQLNVLICTWFIDSGYAYVAQYGGSLAGTYVHPGCIPATITHMHVISFNLTVLTVN